MKGKKIFITGGVGYLGRNIVKRYYADNEIVVYSRDEAKHYYLKKQFPNIRCVVGDIRNYDLLKRASVGCDIGIFATSLKQIGAVDQNVEESVRILIDGALNSRRVAEENNFEGACFISSDKSRGTTTLYGAMKFVAGESFIVNSKGSNVRLSSAVYGNVLNSTGSIIPLIWDAIKNNYELTLYSDRMTRFMIDIEEAIDLIEHSLDVDGYNVIPNLKSFSVKDLFEIYSEKFGLKYKMGTPRISEKLHEMMISTEEAPRTHYDSNKNIYYMHYKDVADGSVISDFTSDQVVISKTDLEEMLNTYNFFKKMKLAITGEGGFLGYHLTQYYKWIREFEVVSLGRDYLDNIHLLKDCDFLIHCAGVNRGNDVYDGNISLTSELVDTLVSNDIKIDIKYTSSTQVDGDSDYGKSKLIASTILKDYCVVSNTKFENYKLPNLFGVFWKPNYNSFINTFCYNIVNGIEVNYNSNLVNLCYVYDAILVMDNQLSEFPTTRIGVDEVYHMISDFNTQYSNGIIPKLETDFSRNLFNTYREFTSNVHQNTRHSDDRGYLVELVKTLGTESQVFFSTTKPGITRGNHFHFGKVERFCVLSGEARIDIRKVGSSEIKSFKVSGSDNRVVDMPVLYTHNITNVGSDDLVCVFWVDEIFNPNDMDTYFESV